MPGRAKTAVATALHLTGTGTVFGHRDDPLILGYHRVVEDYALAARTAIPAMLISTAMLEKHLDWLGQRYRFVTLDEAVAQPRAGRRGQKPMAAITFDDGYRDFYECAFPLLQRKGIPAAVFVVTDLVGTEQLQTHDELYLLLSAVLGGCTDLRSRLAGLLADVAAPRAVLARLRRLQGSAFDLVRALLTNLPQVRVGQILERLREQAQVPGEVRQSLLALDWGMLATLRAAGMTIGSHTLSHPFLMNESRDSIAWETFGSRRRMQEMLGAGIEHFAYPDGQFNSAIVDAVENAGYRHAYGTCRYRDRRRPHLTVPRRLLWEKSVADEAGRFSPAVMSCQVHGLFDMRNGCRHAHRP